MGTINSETSYETLTSRHDFDWISVLDHAGARNYLTGRHGPCPFCGGTDRYRFDLKKVAWICNQCTDGGFRRCDEFLMKFRGYSSFWQLADHIRSFYGFAAGDCVAAEPRPAVAATKKRETISPEKAMARMQAVLAATRDVATGDPVDRYLRRRIPGLAEIPREIRIHPALDYWEAPAERDGRPVFVGKFPAMIVRGLDTQGKLVQIHKTFLTSEGAKAPVRNPKKTDVGLGSNSFALRLGMPDGEVLGVAEGIETALAASLLDGHAVWPCHSASILANFVLPEELRGQVKSVIIYADSDERKQGRKAGSEAAAALAGALRRQGIRSMIVRPAKIGADMADLVAAI